MLQYISEEYCVQNRSKKKGKIICPSCGGNDLGVVPENRFAHCWECGTNYRIGDDDGKYRREYDTGVEFDRQAIRELYGSATDYYHSCIGADQLDYLRSRGIDERSIELFKIGFCPNSSAPMYTTKTARESGLADSRGTPWLAGRIVFPYIAEGAVTDLRGRSMQPHDDMKYKSLYHGSRARGAVYPFNYDEALKRAMASKVLILTEGEIKAVVADQHGFAIMALPGMLSYRPGLVLQAGVKLVVIYDNSSRKEDRLRVDKALRDLYRRVPFFSVVTLPMLDQDKMDVDSYILSDRGGANRLKYMVDNAIEYKRYTELRRF